MSTVQCRLGLPDKKAALAADGKLGVEAKHAHKQTQQDMQDVAATGHEMANKLRSEGDEPLTGLGADCWYSPCERGGEACR